MTYRDVIMLALACQVMFSQACLAEGARIEEDTAEESSKAATNDMWGHIRSESELVSLYGCTVELSGGGPERQLIFKPGTAKPIGWPWVTIPAPPEGWDLERAKTVQFMVKNTGSTPVTAVLWAVGAEGWDAASGTVKLDPGGSAKLVCDLRETFEGKTPRIDPGKIKQLTLMLSGYKYQESPQAEFSDPQAVGTATAWKHPEGRLLFPDVTEGKPEPGKRVRYQLSKDSETGIYCVLYLPPDWEPGKRYPVIAEFPGNQFYLPNVCWSTGEPDGCAMGYGICEGKGAIWVGLPFVNRETKDITINGWGSNRGEDTVNYTVAVMNDLCKHWGGDRENLFLSGFSRGGYACGYIGLWNDDIAPLWKGFIACQGYDGGGWKGTTIKTAVVRAARFRGKSIFMTDNAQEKLQPVVEATDPSVEWIWTQSNLRKHSTAMFLDDRDSAKAVRDWFRKLVAPSDE